VIDIYITYTQLDTSYRTSMIISNTGIYGFYHCSDSESHINYHMFENDFYRVFNNSFYIISITLLIIDRLKASIR
jgi:hypothetical protein